MCQPPHREDPPKIFPGIALCRDIRPGEVESFYCASRQSAPQTALAIKVIYVAYAKYGFKNSDSDFLCILTQALSPEMRPFQSMYAFVPQPSTS